MRGSSKAIKGVLFGLSLLDSFLFAVAVYFTIETDTLLQVAALIVRNAV